MSALQGGWGAKKFAKIKAFTYDNWAENTLKETEKTLADAYNKYLETDLGFRADVPWPEDATNHELRPERILGTQLELLRKIQINSLVFTRLVLADDGRSLGIRITGTDQHKVDDAKPRVEVVVKGLIAVHKFVPSTRFLCFEERIKSVYVKQYGSPGSPAVVIDPAKTSDPIEALAPLHQRDIENMIGKSQLYEVEAKIDESLNIVRQRSQVYSMGIGLGMLKLEKRLKPKQENYYMRDEFMEMMEREDDTRIEAIVEKPVLGGIGQKLLERLMGAAHLLTPVDHKLDTNYEVKPSFRITAILEDPVKSGRNFLLQLEFEDRDDDEIVRLPAKWSNLKQDENLPANLLDVNLLFPSSGRTWNFHINASTVIHRNHIPAPLVQFANRIILDPTRARNIDFLDRYVKFPVDGPGGPVLLRAKTERVWTFRITGTDYRVEAAQTRYGPHANPRPTMQWFCTVRHPDWETHLHMLETMPIGTVAKWAHKMKLFFPEDGYTFIEKKEEDPEEDETKKPSKMAKIGDEMDDLGTEFSNKVNVNGEEGLKPEAGLRLLFHRLIKIAAVVEGRRVE